MLLENVIIELQENKESCTWLFVEIMMENEKFLIVFCPNDIESKIIWLRKNFNKDGINILNKNIRIIDAGEFF